MSITYYLYCKERYTNIIKLLEEINNENDLISDLTSQLDIEFAITNINKLNLIQNSVDFKNKLKYINELKKICEENIYKLCNHEYEEDFIDITPERSEKIIYCKICQHTK